MTYLRLRLFAYMIDAEEWELPTRTGLTGVPCSGGRINLY